MEYRLAGATDLKMAPLIFGGNVLGWTADETTSKQLLNHFTTAGFNTIDTADMYSRWAPGHSGGESETIIGKWMKEQRNRSEVIICTKGGNDMGKGKNLTKPYLLAAADASLKRLQTDYIDLYQTHFDDEVTPVEETLEAYQQLIQSGKVRWIGVSNMSVDRLNASIQAAQQLNLPVYQTLQPHYNLYDRAYYETNLAPLAAQQGWGVLPYFALASGFLTGKYRSPADLGKSVRGGSMEKFMNPRGYAILDALDQLAQKHHCTSAAIALAWLAAQPNIVGPIASATSINQLNELLTFTHIRLDATDQGLLQTASSW